MEPNHQHEFDHELSEFNEYCKGIEAANRRLRQLVEEAFKEGFSDGVTAGHPMGSRSSDSEAWEQSYSKSEVSDE